jgi:hypothetical protein
MALERAHPRAVARAEMVEPVQMKTAVNQERPQLALERHAAARRLTPGGVERDDHVSETPVTRRTHALAL